MTEGTDFLKCFIAIQDYSSENSLFNFVPHFKIGLFGFLDSTFLSSLYILDISLQLDVELVNIFFQSVGSCFLLLTVSFALQEPFQFHEVLFVNC